MCELVEQFLKNGGQIQEVPVGATGEILEDVKGQRILEQDMVEVEQEPQGWERHAHA